MLFSNLTIGELKTEDDMKDYTFDMILLPWEILETARSCFQNKGIERTTILDICKRLNIKETEFYNYFQSLDEVLEILWAR